MKDCAGGGIAVGRADAGARGEYHDMPCWTQRRSQSFLHPKERREKELRRGLPLVRRTGSKKKL